jgi:hypothetical protein
MIRIAEYNGYRCPECGARVAIKVVWYTTAEEDDDHAQSSSGSQGSDPIGQKMKDENGVPKELVDKWVICDPHCDASKGSRAPCSLSGAIPNDPATLSQLAQKVQCEEQDPLYPTSREDRPARKNGANPGRKALQKAKSATRR